MYRRATKVIALGRNSCAVLLPGHGALCAQTDCSFAGGQSCKIQSLTYKNIYAKIPRGNRERNTAENGRPASFSNIALVF